MKIGGIDPTTLPNEEILVIPRGEQEIVFRAKGIADYDEFHELCPTPKPPVKVTKYGKEFNEDDPDYKSVLAAHYARLEAWTVITSLVPSDIEWDTVKPEKPSTWTNWKRDMKNAGLSSVECHLIQKLVYEANSLDEAKLKRAREVFLVGRAQGQSESSGPTTVRENTPSGTPAQE